METLTWIENDYQFEQFVVKGNSVFQKIIYIPTDETLNHKCTIMNFAKRHEKLLKLCRATSVSGSEQFSHIPKTCEEQNQRILEIFFDGDGDVKMFDSIIVFKNKKLTELNDEERKLWERITLLSLKILNDRVAKQENG